MVSGGCGMGAGRREGWKTLRRWLLWWKIDPAELERQVEGYEKVHRLATAQGFGYLLAVMAAAQAAYGAGLAFSPGTAALFPVAWFQAGVALSLAALGGFLLRGSRAAAIGLMVVYSIQTVFIANCALQTEPAASFLLLSLAGWSIFMRVFYLSLRVERERTRLA